MKRFSLADTTSRSPSVTSLLTMSPESTSRRKSSIGLIGQTTSTNAKMANDVQTQMDLLKVHLQSLDSIGNHSKDTNWTIGDRPTPRPDVPGPSRFRDQENPEAIFPHPMPACLNSLCPKDEVIDELIASSTHLDNTSLDDKCQGTVGKNLNKVEIQYADETTTEIENGLPNQAAIFQRPKDLQLEAGAVESEQELQHSSIETAALSPAKFLAASYRKVIEASSVLQETNGKHCKRIKNIPEEVRCVASEQQTPLIQWTPPQDHIFQWTSGTDA